MKIYFVCVNHGVEVEVISKVKPDRLLLSYYYLRKRTLKEFTDSIGYIPKIMMDSGAYTAFTKNSNISVIDYMNYLKANEEYIHKYIMLDVIGNPELTYKYYEIMRMEGFSPMPVFHYGDDEKYLQRFISHGEDYIALGNTVPIKSKRLVSSWINHLMETYPGIKFHLLGSSSKEVANNTDVYSVDSSTWVRLAFTGKPKHIVGRNRAGRILRAEWNMRDIIERGEES